MSKEQNKSAETVGSSGWFGDVFISSKIFRPTLSEL